jgi:hypothetical protein
MPYSAELLTFKGLKDKPIDPKDMTIENIEYQIKDNKIIVIPNINKTKNRKFVGISKDGKAIDLIPIPRECNCGKPHCSCTKIIVVADLENYDKLYSMIESDAKLVKSL